MSDAQNSTIGSLGTIEPSEIGQLGTDGPNSEPNDGTLHGYTVFEPAAASGNGNDVGNGSAGSQPGKRKRGRPPGSRNGNSGNGNGSANTSAKKKATVDISGLEKLLFSTHAMLAGLTKTPEFCIDQSEAKMLAEGAANVARHYNVIVNEKTQDWANLIMCLGAVYGTRFVAISTRKKSKAKKPGEDNVVDMEGQPINPLNLPLNPQLN